MLWLRSVVRNILPPHTKWDRSFSNKTIQLREQADNKLHCGDETVGVKMKGNSSCSSSVGGMELPKNRRQVAKLTCEDFVWQLPAGCVSGFSIFDFPFSQECSASAEERMENYTLKMTELCGCHIARTLGTPPPHGAWPMSAEWGHPRGDSEWTNPLRKLTFAL